jgi:GTP-sensing pleiotropic transcriptional regulator CodY
MSGIIWKSNHDKLKREQEKQQQFQQYMQKMAQIEVNHQEKLAQEAADKARKDEQRRVDNEKARLETERFDREMRKQEYARLNQDTSSYEDEEALRHIFD